MSPPDRSDVAPARSRLTGEPQPAPPGPTHMAFVAALAAMADAGDSAGWTATVAGLVTLRLVDRHIARAQHALPVPGPATGHAAGHAAGGAPARARSRSPREWRSAGRSTERGGAGRPLVAAVVDAARTAVDAVSGADATTRALRQLIAASAVGDREAMAVALFRYAHLLRSDGRWTLAGDVYETVLRLAAAPDGDGAPHLRSLVPHAYDRLGYVRRMAGDIAGASAAYAAGRAAADMRGDRDSALRIRIAQANVLRELGNYPAAAAALDEIIADALASRRGDTAAGERERRRWRSKGDDVLALARHDRGVIANAQRQYELALEQYLAAWRAYRHPLRRERVWSDIARNLADMGLRAVARDIHLVLYVSAQEREVRVAAAINLLELAVLDGEREAFLSLRSSLHDAARRGVVPAYLAPWARLYEAYGEARFGSVSAAIALLEETQAVATAVRANQALIRADEAIAELRAGRPISALDEAVDGSKAATVSASTSSLPAASPSPAPFPGPTRPVSAAVEQVTRLVRSARRQMWQHRAAAEADPRDGRPPGRRAPPTRG